MPDDATRFVDYIVELAQDTGPRAALRSGLGRTVAQSVRMHAYLSRWTTDSKPHEQAVRYTLAALIAYNPTGAIPATSPGNIGVSVSLHHDLAYGTRESSIHLLTRQPAGQLCRMLTRVVLTLRAEDVPVDFARLLKDASSWPRQHQDTGRRWLQAFYRSEHVDTAS